MQQPSMGKSARDEGFPVAARWLPVRARRHVLAFYRFARAADDIADSPDLDVERKLLLLGEMEAALSAPAKAEIKVEAGVDIGAARALRASLLETGITVQHALDLLSAFRRDAQNRRIDTWDDLLGYCQYSAAPVGHFLLDLFRENNAEARAASDALCAALQIANHVRDARRDYESLGRIYLPEQWFEEMAVPHDALGRALAAGQLRALLDRALDGVDHLLAEARPLPGRIRAWPLCAQAAATLAWAERLAARLRAEDPLAHDVVLSAPDRLACSVRAVRAGLFGV
jgi:squalene synthase HpnC